MGPRRIFQRRHGGQGAIESTVGRRQQAAQYLGVRLRPHVQVRRLFTAQVAAGQARVQRQSGAVRRRHAGGESELPQRLAQAGAGPHQVAAARQRLLPGAYLVEPAARAGLGGQRDVFELRQGQLQVLAYQVNTFQGQLQLEIGRPGFQQGLAARLLRLRPAGGGRLSGGAAAGAQGPAVVKSPVG